jgi:hypothetical protein
LSGIPLIEIVSRRLLSTDLMRFFVSVSEVSQPEYRRRIIDAAVTERSNKLFVQVLAIKDSLFNDKLA